MHNNFEFIHLATVSSTMDEARKRLPNACLVIADEQIQGRGRRGRTWHSQKGNLYMTLALSIPKEIKIAKLALTAGLAIREALMQYVTPERVKCKWPNDVLIGGQKIAGVLIETEQIDDITYAMIGIGVNIKIRPDLDTTIKSTSLVEHTTQQIDAKDLGKTIADNIINLMNNQQINIREYWFSTAYGLNSPVKYQPTYSDGYQSGYFIGIAEDGGCIISNGSNIEVIYTSSLIFPEGDK